MMKKSNCYIYYNYLSQSIIKIKYFHIFFFMIENLFSILLIFDCTNIFYGKNVNDHFKLLKYLNPRVHLNQTLIVIVLYIYFIIIYIPYFFSNIFLKYTRFQKFFINYYEIFHIRIFSFFFFLTTLTLKSIHSVIAFILISFYFIVSLFHILYFHLPIYSLENIRFVYDCYSSLIDSIGLIEKALLILSNFLAKKHPSIAKHFFYISISICIFLTINIIYIMKKKSFLFMNNVSLNKFRTCLIFIKMFIYLLCLVFVKEELIKKRMNILYINFTIFILVIFMLLYDPYDYIHLNTYGYLVENSYFYFFSILSKNGKNKILFYKKINECVNKELLNPGLSQDILSLTHNFLCDNDYFQFIQLFIKEIKKNKINELFKRRILMIRLIMLVNKFKNKDFILSMNLRSLFYLINLNNNLEKTYDVVYKLELMIKFLSDGNDILFLLNDIIHKNFDVSILELVELSDLLTKIASRTYKQKLLKNKSNESSYYSIICGIFYEEILNKSMTKNNFQIRENLIQYEDSINYLYENNNKITLTFNFFTDECRIIQIGKDLFDNFNGDFSLLFPEDFRDYQMLIFKNGIFDINYESLNQKRRSFHDKKKSNLFNLLKSVSPSKDISFKFIVKKNKRGELGLLFLDLKILFHVSCKEYIVLNGFYFLGKNCLFTYKKNHRDQEKIYRLELDYEENEDEYRIETLKNYLKRNKISPTKVTKIYTFILNGFIYMTYSIENKKSNQETNFLTFLQTTKNFNETFVEIYNQKIEDSSSVAGSLLSGISSDESKFLGTHLKKSNFNKNINHKQVYLLYIYQNLIFFISGISLVMILFELFIKKKQIETVFHNYSILNRFRTLNRIYYHSIPSVMIAMCISKGDKENCVQFLNEYNKKFNERYPEIDLNFTLYFSIENYIKIDYFKNVSSKFYSEIYSLKDHRTDRFFEYKINYSNILQNEGYFYLVNQTIEFKEAIKIFFNSMIVLISDDYITKPIYLLNVSTNPLSEIFFNKRLEDYQLSYYTVLANFNTYCQNFYKIHLEFSEVMNSKLRGYRNLNYIFLCVNFILSNLFFIFVILYLQSYKIVSLEIFNIIKKRTNNKEFRVTFIKKIELLSVLLKIYSINPTQLIGNLEDLYSSYRKREKEKIKSRNQSQSNIEFDDFNVQLYTKEDIKKSNINVLYTKVFLIVFSLVFLFHAILLIIYIIYFGKFSTVFHLIHQSSGAENTGYRDFIFYVNRVYNNFSESLMESWLNKTILQDTSDIIYTLYLITRERQGLGDLYLPLSNYFTIDCKDFYEKIEDNIIVNFNYFYKGENIYRNLSKFCAQNKIMEHNDQYKINTEQFSYIKKGLIQSDFKNMDEVIQTLNDNEFFRSGLFCLLIYRPLRTAENKFVYTNALKTMKYYMYLMSFIDTGFSLFLLISSAIIFTIVFIKRINIFLKQISRMKEVFIIAHFEN